MRKLVFTLPLALALAAPAALLSVTSFPGTSQAAAPTAEEIAARVQAFYDSTKTFRATFTYVNGEVHNRESRSPCTAGALITG